MGLNVSNPNSNPVGTIQNKQDVKAETSETHLAQSPATTAPEIVSKDYGEASKAVAMAQIMIGEKITNKTTPEEYIAKLTKQGKQINKDFKVDNLGKNSTFIDILNPQGQTVKSIQFSEYNFFENSPPQKTVSVRYVNPNSHEAYKRVCFDENGEAVLNYNDPITGNMLTSERLDKDAKTIECCSVTDESGCEVTKIFHVEKNS